jgi:pilus assembly protein CpaB
MSPMRLIILLVAAGAAIAAVFLVRSIQTPQAATAAVNPAGIVQVQQAPENEILVARHAIQAGKFISVDDLKWQSWPGDAKIEAFADKKKSPDALEKAVGAVATVSVAEGEPIVLTRFVHPGEAGFMSAMLTPGMRAVAIEIAPETAAGGFIQPNDRVDVIVTREVEQSKSGGSASMQNIRSDLILSNIRVLAIDATYSKPAAEGEEKKEGEGGSVTIEGSRATLELSEADSTLLASAQKAGTLSLILRSVSGLGDKSGATNVGRVYRDGLPKESTGVRVYRYGTETTRATAG